jgi:hypothetical protein
MTHFTDPATGRPYAVDPRTGQTFWLDQQQPPRRGVGLGRVLLIAAGVIVGGFILLVVIGLIAYQPKATPTAASTTATVTSMAATPSPAPKVAAPVSPTHSATPAAPAYPPTTVSGLVALGHTGDASVLHVFKRESVGLGSCPQPALHATIQPGLSPRQVIADEVALFVGEGLQQNPCGAVLWVFNSEGDDTGNGFTAGMVNYHLNEGILVIAGTTEAPSVQFTVK